MKVTINYTTRAVTIDEQSNVFQHSHNVDQIQVAIDHYDSSQIYKMNFTDASGTRNISRVMRYIGTVNDLYYFRIYLSKTNTTYDGTLTMSVSIYDVTTVDETTTYTKVWTSEEFTQYIEPSIADTTIDIDSEETTIIDEIYAAIALKLNITHKGYFFTSTLGMSGVYATTQAYLEACYNALTDAEGDFVFSGIAIVSNNSCSVTDAPNANFKAYISTQSDQDYVMVAEVISFGRESTSDRFSLYYGHYYESTFLGWYHNAEYDDVKDWLSDLQTDIEDGTITAYKATRDGSGNVITSTYQLLSNLVTAFQVTPDDTHYPSEKLVKDNIDDLQGQIDDIEDGTTTVDKATKDADGNTISTTYIKVATKGAANGVAPLNASALIDSLYLPSYVDDVIEVATYSALPATGEAGKIYVVIADETSGGNASTYRWATSVYVQITDTLSAAEAKALYESNSDTNAFTDAEKTKLGTLLSGTSYYTQSQINSLLESLKLIQGVTNTQLGSYGNTDTISFASVQEHDYIIIHADYDSSDHASITLPTANLTSDAVFKLHIQNANVDVTFSSWVVSCSAVVTVRVYGISYVDTESQNVVDSHTGTNYIDSSDDVKETLELLDAQIKVNEDAIADNASDISDLSDTISALESSTEVKQAAQDVQIASLTENIRKISNGDTSATVSGVRNISLGKDVARTAPKVQSDAWMVDAVQLFYDGSFTIKDASYKPINIRLANGTPVYYNNTGLSFNFTSYNSAYYITNDYTNYPISFTPLGKYYLSYFYKGTSGHTSQVKVARTNFQADLLETRTLTMDGTKQFDSFVDTDTIGISTLVVSIYGDRTDNSLMTYYDMRLYDISKLISAKQYSPLYATTFDLMTDAQIKAQMDAWVLDGTLPYSGVKPTLLDFLHTSVGKNKFDKTKYVTSYAYKIPVKPSTTYVWSASTAYKTYDINGTEVTSGTASTITTSSATYFIAFSGIASVDTFQLELGSTATAYEAFAHTEMFVQANALGYRVPNGTKDTIEQRDGKMWHVKRLGTASVSGVVAVNLTNYPLAKSGGQFINYLTATNIGETGVIGTDSTTGAGFLIYELATPIETQIPTTGELIAYPNGSHYIQTALPVVGAYTTSIAVANTAHPISSLIFVRKVTFNADGTTTYTELATSSATIAGDGLSFTHTGLTAGDIVYFGYVPTTATTNGYTTVTYYDNRFVVVDSVTSTVYAWAVTVASGTPTISLTAI